MIVEIAAGPASIGTASGVIAMSSFAAPSAVSAAVSSTGDRCALSISNATSNRTSAPATCTAASVMPSSENNHWPASAKPPKIAKATRQATRAMRSRWMSVQREVMARKAGTVARGSTMTKRELKASTPYSVGVMRSSRSGLPEQLRAWIGVGALGQPLVERGLLRRDGGGHDDVQIQKQISITASRGRQALVFQPELALCLASRRHLHLHRLGQCRSHDFSAQDCFPRIDRQGHVNVAALAAEDRVGFDGDVEV